MDGPALTFKITDQVPIIFFCRLCPLILEIPAPKKENKNHKSSSINIFMDSILGIPRHFVYQL